MLRNAAILLPIILGFHPSLSRGEDLPALGKLIDEAQAALNAVTPPGSEKLATIQQQVWIGHALAAEGRIEEAIEFGQLSDVPESHNKYVRECLYLAHQRRHKLPDMNTMKRLFKTSKLDSANYASALIQNWTAKVLSDRGAYGESAAEIERISDLDKNTPLIIDAWANLAEAQASHGLHDDALKNFEQAVRTGRRRQYLFEVAKPATQAIKLLGSRDGWTLDTLRAIEKHKREQRGVTSAPINFQEWMLLAEGWATAGKKDLASKAAQKSLFAWRELDGATIVSTGLRLERVMQQLGQLADAKSVTARVAREFRALAGPLKLMVVSGLVHSRHVNDGMVAAFRVPQTDELAKQAELEQAMRLIESCDPSICATACFLVSIAAEDASHPEFAVRCLDAANKKAEHEDAISEMFIAAAIGRMEVLTGEEAAGFERLNAICDRAGEKEEELALIVGGLALADAGKYTEAYALLARPKANSSAKLIILSSLCELLSYRDIEPSEE